MKIVWLSHKGELRGGAELTLLEASRALMAKDHQFHAVAPNPGSLTDRLNDLRVPVRVIPYDRWTHVGAQDPFKLRARRFRANLRGARELARFFREVQPDVVVSNTITICAGAIAAKRLGIPHVWYIHELYGKHGHGQFFDWGDALSLFLMDKLSQKLILNSASTYNVYRPHIQESKLCLVYYANDISQRSNGHMAEKDDSFSLIQVGVRSPGKRPEDAIRAVSLLRGRGMNVSLRLMGHDYPGNATLLRSLVHDLQLEQWVEFVPFGDPFPYVAASDVVLLCSRNEGLPRVVVEAMKLGKPVVGANSGPMPELIRNGWNGFLFPPGDVEELANKIGIFYNDRMLLKSAGKNAQDWSDEIFSTEKYASNLLAVFAQAVRRTRGAPVQISGQPSS